jgi:Domain of unknown function (DUF4149)
MQRALCTLFLVSWALWLGGILFLFLAVTALFHQSHSLGASAAPSIFLSFETYHLILAGISIILCLPLLRTPTSRAWRWIAILISVGCVTSLITSQWITPRINSLHLQGLIDTPEFRHLHGISFALYLCEALALFLVGLILPSTKMK